MDVRTPAAPVLTPPEPRTCRTLTLEQEVVVLRKRLDESVVAERATAVEWKRSQDEAAALKKQLQKVAFELEDAHDCGHGRDEEACGECLECLKVAKEAALTKLGEVSAELEQFRMRLAGALTTVEGHGLDLQGKPGTPEYLRTCPTIAACVRVRWELGDSKARVSELEALLATSQEVNAEMRDQRQELAIEVARLRLAARGA